MRACLVAAFAALGMSVGGEEATAYRRFADVSANLKDRAANSGGAAKASVIGKSFGGRDILLVTIGTGEGLDTRPALLVVAGVEGDGIAGSEIAATFAAELMAAQDERTRKLLAERTVYVIVRLNPDGIERFFDEVKRQDTGTARKWDEDKDGAEDEDGPDDLDGDGLILVMRVEDAAGEWVADEKDAGFMRKPDAVRGEHGAWKLLAEGKDDDGDGAWNEDGAGGVDLNSNFPWNYRFHAPRSGAYQAGEPESRALAEFVAAHPNIEAAFTFASNDNVIRQVAPAPPPHPLPDPGNPVMALDAGDVLPLARFAENYRTKLGRERRDPLGLREGGVAEWLYFHWGILSLGGPGWSVPWKPADAKGLAHEDGPGREARWEFRWMRENRASEWVEWHAVAHPDFPGKKVEIGAWKPYATVLPPAGEMEALAAKHGAFLRDVLDAFPRVAIKGVAAKKLDAALWEITATIANEGALPTALRQGVRTQRARAVRVDFVSATGKLTAGDKVTLIPVLAAGGVKELKWVLQAREGSELEIRAETDRAGQAAAKLELK
ncbi:MAG: M14 family zinc carboxypeptidase [Planctomycetota bacterium]